MSTYFVVYRQNKIFFLAGNYGSPEGTAEKKILPTVFRPGGLVDRPGGLHTYMFHDI